MKLVSIILNRKRVPTAYSGLSFDTSVSDDIELFDSLSDKKKWEMGYWVEYQTLREGLRYGIIVGLFIGLLIGYIVWSI